jgi:DNA-binding NtrC family response regulator
MGEGPTATPVPGALLVFSGNAPALRPLAVGKSPLVLGNDTGAGAMSIGDGKMSGRHAELRVSERGWSVRDLGSRNGTRVNGQAVTGELDVSHGAVLRVGYSIFLLLDDVRRFQTAQVRVQDGFVLGPTMQSALDRVALSARGGATVLITGENGAGKELAAKTFYEHSGRKSGELVSVNCASIHKDMAESELFGTTKGSGTGLTDRSGLAQRAHNGVLFLDEIGELEPEAQATFLRFVENLEVRPVGATVSSKVSVRFVSATNRPLRDAIEAGRFRRDLYHRVAEMEVRIPPLRERREEIPFLVDTALREQLVREPHATFVEAALLRPWPGNVRELLGAVRAAALSAHQQANARVTAEHLDPLVGTASATPPPAAGRAAPQAVAPAPAAKGRELSAEQINAAISAAQGKLSAAARALGLHRTQLYREMEKRGIPRPGAQNDDDDDA